MAKEKSNSQTIMLAVLGIVIVVLAIVVVTLLPKQQASQDQGKTVSVPTEIKSNQEAATLEKDTSSILGDVSDALNSIDNSLPEV